MPKTAVLTLNEIVAKHAEGVAFVADEETPAANVSDFVDHLRFAVEHLTMAGIDADDLDRGADFLAEAQNAEGVELDVLLKKANDYLAELGPMIDEYRDAC